MSPYNKTNTDSQIFLVNRFILHSGSIEVFKELWNKNAEIMKIQNGFVEAWLTTNMSIKLPKDPVVIYNFAIWESGRDFDQARTNTVWLSSIQRMLKDARVEFTNEVVPTTAILHITK